SNATATTVSNGSATFIGLTETGTVGSYTLSVGATALPTATAGITLNAGAASVIAANSPTTQSAPAGSAVSSPPSVIVHDGSGNPVQGVTVTFRSEERRVGKEGRTRSTHENGIANVGSWTLSKNAGTHTLTRG